MAASDKLQVNKWAAELLGLDFVVAPSLLDEAKNDLCQTDFKSVMVCGIACHGDFVQIEFDIFSKIRGDALTTLAALIIDCGIYITPANGTFSVFIVTDDGFDLEIAEGLRSLNEAIAEGLRYEFERIRA